MTVSATQLPRQADRHTHRVFDAVRRGPQAVGDEPSELVASSWSRCLNDYRLHPDRPREPTVLARADLEARRERLADVIDCARYEMTTLYQQLADAESAVLLTDTDGVILHMVSSPEFAAEVGPLGLRAGVDWSETEAGTNGMGTCLAAAKPIAVRRDEHFFTQLTALTCSAVPVLDPAGEMVGTLDVTSRSTLMQQHVLVLLGMTARMIENRLIDRRFSGAHPLHFHSRPEFVYTLHEGRLAVDDDGRILAANRSALFQLGLPSVEELRTRRLDEIFQTSLDDLLQRSASSSFHPVVTYRVNAAHRFFAVARRPASEASVALPGWGLQPLAAVTPLPPQPARPAITRGPGEPVPVREPASRVVGGVGKPGFRDARLVAHLETARRVIARHTPLLLCAETGAGKEVFARAVHANSPHAGGSFVAINCASLPESLVESELFGYRAGAFTGAQRNGRRGKILQADGGTLFLDEIGDMPLELQARLLRVLDERQVTPLGTEETHAVDFQLISASHRRLPELVQEGRFREDLYYRLAGIELQLPPLRERSDRRELIRQVLAEEGGAGNTLLPEAERLLMEHRWPGNVRQLRHVLRSAAALADEGAAIGRDHLQALLAPVPAPGGEASSGARSVAMGGAINPQGADAAGGGSILSPATEPPLAVKLNPIQANERQVLLRLLEQHRWNVSNVAKALDVSRNTLYRKLHKLHIALSHPD